MPSHISRITLLATLLCGGAAAHAADYFVVVPVGTSTVAPVDPDENISVTLTALALPDGQLGKPYAGVNLTDALLVTGDPDFNGTGVTWSIVSGQLPGGVSLAPDGRISGTPQTSGVVSFTARAAYKSKDGMQTYQVEVTDLHLTIQGYSTAPVAKGKPYTLNLADMLYADGAKVTSGASFGLRAPLPAGLTLANGVVSGSPTAEGYSTISVLGQYRGHDVAQDIPLSVYSVNFSLATTFIPPGKVGVPMTIDFGPLLTKSFSPFDPGGMTVQWSIDPYGFDEIMGGVRPLPEIDANGRLSFTPVRATPVGGNMVRVYARLSGNNVAFDTNTFYSIWITN